MNSHICLSFFLLTQEEIASNFPVGWEVLCLYPLQNYNSCLSVWLFFLSLSSIQSFPLSSCALFSLLTFCLLCFTIKLSGCACLSLSFFHTSYFNTPFNDVFFYIPWLPASFLLPWKLDLWSKHKQKSQHEKSILGLFWIFEWLETRAQFYVR